MRVLFASPYKPFALAENGSDPLDPFTGQLSPTQGPFAMTMHSHYWAFYLMAENLGAECCVLEHPTLAEFEAELRKGYDVVGFQVNWNTLRRTAEMIQRAEEIAPNATRVVGGYAVAQVLDPLPPDAEVAEVIRNGAHHLCREEGVRFMRRLIGDLPAERPITQYTLPRSGSYLAALGPKLRMPGGRPVLAALGCPAACEFCNTSAFFQYKKIRVAEPDEAFAFMRHHLVADGAGRAMFELFDEDLFWDPEYARALGRRIRGDETTAGRIGYFTFGSVRTLSKLDPEELAANGLSTVWIGVESTLDDALEPGAHLKKRRGRDLRALFSDLREYGISVVGSMVLGFDFQTPENVHQDIDAFISLEPTISQVTPLIPCAGTRLYERMKQQQRLSTGFGWTLPGGFRARPAVEPLHMTWQQLNSVIDTANRRLYLETGPSALKAVDTAVRGYLRLRGHPVAALGRRAEILRESAIGQYPALVAVLANAPSAAVADRAREVQGRWIEALGEPSAELSALGHQLSERIRAFSENPTTHASLADPPTRWSYYRPGAPPEIIKQAAA
jgi:haloalkane dehalogenase